MFIRPQILSTPHMMTSMDETSGGACQQSYGSGCSTGFSCSPFQGSNCIDATYIEPAIIAIVGGAIGGVIGGIAIAK
jgi:hypothetical protein